MRLVRKTRTSFIFAAVLFFSTNSFAEKIIIPINGYGEHESTTMPLEFEWQESWLTQGDSFSYNHGLARIAAAFSTISYSDCSNPAGSLVGQTYQKLGFKQSDTLFLYDLDYKDKEYGINQSAFSFATKKTSSGCDLVFIVIRGTPDGPNEWLSNLNINDSGASKVTYHEGFLISTKRLRKYFEEFIRTHEIDLKNAVLFITGHSRGAAQANLLSAFLADENLINTNNVFTYAFATPNVTVRTDVHDERYNFIWNISNGEDLVPTLPPVNDKWNFTKFGRTRTTINFWNCEDPEVYTEKYIPKVNFYYSKFLGREFHPFKKGTFITTKTSDTFSFINKNPKKYYKSFFPLHKKLYKAIENAFSNQNENNRHDSTSGIEKLINSLKRHSDTRTRNLIDYALSAFVDMHTMHSYFSWIYTLKENELFSETESSIVRLHGFFNGAVIDTEGNIYAQIYDGVLKLRETKAPLAAWQFPIGNFGLVSIGFPSHKNYSLLIYKDSILPTPIHVQIERYSSDGIQCGIISEKIVGARVGTVYNFAVGKEPLEQANNSEPCYNKLKKSDAKLAIRDGKLKNTDVSHMNFGIHIDTDGIMEIGMSSGLQKFYIEVLLGADLNEIKHRHIFSMGCGTQHSFCGPFMGNLEAFIKFARYQDANDEEWRFTLVPAVRALLSIKPAKRFQFFTGMEFNFYFDDLNSGIFEDGYRSGGIPSIGNDDFRLYPALQFGIKL